MSERYNIHNKCHRYKYYSILPIFYIVEVVKLVIVTITRQCDPQVSEHSVSLNDSTDHHSAKEAEESEEEGEDPGPEAAAAVVTAGVALPAGGAVLRPVLLALLYGLLGQCGVETLPALGQTSLGLQQTAQLEIL